MSAKINKPGIAHLGFNASSAALYISPEGERPSYLARYRVIEMPRDSKLGEDCPNVRYLRALERGANECPR